MADTIYLREFEAAPDRLCRAFGGRCLGSGCVFWEPLPSPNHHVVPDLPTRQKAVCMKERGEEPIHRAEAERKARRARSMEADYASGYWAGKYWDSPREGVFVYSDKVAASYREEAEQWEAIAAAAPTREEYLAKCA